MTDEQREIKDYYEEQKLRLRSHKKLSSMGFDSVITGFMINYFRDVTEDERRFSLNFGSMNDINNFWKIYEYARSRKEQCLMLDLFKGASRRLGIDPEESFFRPDKFDYPQKAFSDFEAFSKFMKELSAAINKSE